MKTSNNKVDEIGPIIIDKEGRILIENKGGYVDIPRINRSIFEDKDKLIEEKYNKIFEEKSPYFYKLYTTEKYRYYIDSSKKIKTEYEYAITNNLPKTSKYKFLTLNHVNSLLSSLNYDRYLEYIKEDLKELILKLQEIYKDSISLSEFSKKYYLEHLTDSFITNTNEDSLKNKYPSIDFNRIIRDTLNFIKNIKNFSIDTKEDSLTFQLEKIYPIKSFSNDNWYSDILGKISKNNREYLISTYLINSYFNNDIKIYLDENEYDIDNLGKVKGLPRLIIYSKDLNMMNKVNNLEKTKKLNYRKNYTKRY